MKKRILSLILAAAMILSVCPNVFAANSGFYTEDSELPTYSGNGPLGLAANDGSQASATVTENVSGIAQETLDTEKIVNSAEGAVSSLVDAAPYKAEDTVTFMVMLDKDPTLAVYSADEIAKRSSGAVSYERALTQALNSVKNQVAASFGATEGFKMGYTYTVAAAGFSVTTQYGNREAIAALPGVARVYVAPTYNLPEDYSLNLGTEFQPMTSNATTMIGADVLNASGYTGKGMRVCILDTGIVENHPSFQAMSEDKLTETSLTFEEVESVWPTLNASHSNLFVEGSYVSNKIPFKFNYYTQTFDVSHATAGSDHGTHVAGISAANKTAGSTVIGVAPDAQIIVMQVFGRSGAGWDTIMAALEDAVRLNVDSCNLSLGSAAGFVDPEGDMLDVVELFKQTDISLVMANGNDTNNALNNMTGLNMSLSSNPDVGLAGTPASYTASLAVASIDNDGVEQLYFTVNGTAIGFNDTASSGNVFVENMRGQTLDFVCVPGVGADSDYEGIDVTGKVAVISRGQISFPEKQTIAQTHGAIAAVIYNNDAGLLNMQINSGVSAIPCVSITMADGAKLTALGTGKLTVCSGDLKKFNIEKAVSDFSSWGTTSDMTLKPEIAGVGGNIYSCTDPSISGSNYGTMSGTSMASPQVTGAMTIIMEYLRENYDFSEAELRRVAANIAMSTANPVMLGELEYSPRQQGAGLVDLVKATTTGAYLSNPEASEGRPKAEMGDDDAKTGVYTFPFEIHNFGTEDLTYSFRSSVLTETLYMLDGQGYIGNEPTALDDADVTVTAPAADGLKYDFNNDGKITTADARVLLRHVNGIQTLPASDPHAAYVDVNGDGTADKADVDVITAYCAELDVSVNVLAPMEVAGGSAPVESVTVPAGETMKLYATITLTDADKQYLNNFENGMFVEGYLYADTEDGVDLAMPFLSFYGDWSAAPIFDEPSETAASLYPRYVFTNYSTVGTNPYLRNGKSGDQYNAFSYTNPIAEIDFGMLRNAKKLNFTVTDKETGEEYFYIYGTDMTKSHYNASYGQVIPFYIYGDEVWNGLDADGKKLPDGTTVTYAVEAWLDDGDDVMDDAFYFDITLDDSIPQILNVDSLNDSLTYENGATYLDLDLVDNRYIAAVLFVDPNGIILGRYEVDNEPGVASTNRFEITGYGTDFTIIVADYACNEYEIDVVLDYGEHANDVVTVKPLDKERIYGSDPAGNGDVDVGWFSANKADMSDLKNETYDTTNYYYSAEYVNGNVIAQSAITGDLVLVQPRGTYWATTSLVSQAGKQIGDPNVWVIYDLALVHNAEGKDRLFGTGWYYEGDYDGDGKDDGANYIFEVSFSDWNGSVDVQRLGKVSGTDGVDLLTLGATTEGQLYGIDTNAKLYTVDPESGECTYVATTGFVNVANYNGANLIQSMGYDHNTGDMYWFATSQSVSGSKYVYAGGTYKLNLETGAITKVDNINNLTGSTGLFIPNDLESDLFELGKNPTGFQLDPYETMMATGQTKRLNVKWEPWNCTPTKVTWTSSDETVATVNDAGFVKAVSEGNAVITATAQVWLEGWDTTTWEWIDGEWRDYSAECSIEVIPSEENLYGFVVSDFKASFNNFSWIKYSDQNLYAIENLGGNKLPEGHYDYNLGTDDALWQGGAYYDGYMYLVDKEVWEDMGVAGTGVYRFSVTPNGDEPATFGELEFIGLTPNIEIGNLGFDYKTGRMYGVDLTNGGLALVDIETGAVDALGAFAGAIGGPAIAPAMCVVAREDMDDSLIIISDMYGKLYTVDPDSMNTVQIGQCKQDSTWYYAALTYDYNTDNIYWNPCMSQGQSPMLLVKLGEDQWSGQLAATVVDIGDVSTKAGVEQTVIFTIPENEPETHYIPIESMTVTSARDVKGLVGGVGKVTVSTTPSRPSVLRKAFTSSDENVVVVDNFGNLTYTGVGTATVTCTMQNRPNEDGTPGQVFSDSITVTVYEAAGDFAAFLSYDTGDNGSGYYDYWLNMTDARVDAVTLGTRCINVYDVNTGAYYDGYYYAVTRSTLNVLRISAQDPSKYTTLGTSNLSGSERVVSMAVDFTTGTMYAVTGDNYLATMNLDNGQVTKLVQLSNKVCTIAVDGEGTIYVAGSASESSDAVVYKVNKTSGACTALGTLYGAYAYTDNWDYADSNYNSQMAYDYTTNRLYLYASVYTQGSRNSVSGLFLMDLDDGMTMFAGKLGIDFQRGAAVKYGAAYLGFMDIVPDADQIPVAPVNGVMLNKTTGRVPVGGTAELIATVRPSNAVDKTVTWSSSDETVATVDENGVVTGVSEGTVTITVTSNETGVSNAAVLTVVDLSGATSIAYTVSADLDSLVSFNPAAPAQTMEIVDVLSGGNIIKGLAYYEGKIYYATEGGFPDIYSYNMTTHQTSYVGSALNYNNCADITVDQETGRLYVCGGLYVNAFDLRTLVQGSMPAASLLEQRFWGEAEGIAACEDGIYFLSNSNGVHRLFKADKALNGSELIGVVDIDAVAGKTEMSFDPASGLLYVTDANDGLHTIDPVTCECMPVDVLGNGVDMNGLTIVASLG